MSDVSVVCGSAFDPAGGTCAQPIRLGQVACERCGRPVTAQDRAALHARLEGGDFVAHERGKRMREASKWIGVLSILFAVSGPIAFAMQKSEADKALAHLAQFADDDALQPINGHNYTAGQLRAEVAREPLMALGVNLLVAVLMAVLWLWARRAPLPAIACAFALFLIVHVGSALVDPSSILKGIIVKVIALVVLGKGLKAALAARAAMNRPAT
jgi:hypothetical protein